MKPLITGIRICSLPFFAFVMQRILFFFFLAWSTPIFCIKYNFFFLTNAENWHYQLIAAKVLRSHQRTRRNKNKISFQEKKNNKEVISFSFIFCSTILDSVDDLIREAEREAYYSVLRAFRGQSVVGLSWVCI